MKAKAIIGKWGHVGWLAEWSGVIIFRLASLLSVCFIVAFVGMGLWELCHGIIAFFWDYDPGSSKEALKLSLSGIEFFLLAPLAYLVLRSVAEYFEDLKDGEEIKPQTRESLLEVKALTTALLIAVLATHLVSNVIAGRGTSKSTTESTESETALADESIENGPIFLLITLSFYFFGLEFLARHDNITKSSGRRHD